MREWGWLAIMLAPCMFAADHNSEKPKKYFVAGIYNYLARRGSQQQSYVRIQEGCESEHQEDCKVAAVAVVAQKPICISEPEPARGPKYFTFSHEHMSKSIQNSWNQRKAHMPSQEKMLEYHSSAFAGFDNISL